MARNKKVRLEINEIKTNKETEQCKESTNLRAGSLRR